MGWKTSTSGGGQDYSSLELARCLTTKTRIDAETETLITTIGGAFVDAAIAFDSRQDCVSSTEVFGALGSSSPQAQAVCFAENSRGELRLEGGDGQRTGALSTGGGKPSQGQPVVCITGQITHTLKADGFDASEDGTGRGQPIVAVHIQGENHRQLGYGACESAGDLSTWTVRSVRESEGGSAPQERGLARPFAGESAKALPELSHQGTSRREEMHAVRPAAQGTRVLRNALSEVQEVERSDHCEGQPVHGSKEGHGEQSDSTVQSGGLRGQEPCEGILPEACAAGSPRHTRNDQHQQGRSNAASVGHQAYAVRRLTPRECARLQGFQDNYLSQVMMRGKPAADGPMYKALGNSWAVPNVAWIGQRIDARLRVLSGSIKEPQQPKP